MEAVNVVLADDLERDIGRVTGGIGMAGIDEVAARPGGAVLAPREPVFSAGGVEAVLVEGVAGIGGGAVLGAPDGGGDDPGMHVDSQLVWTGVVGTLDEVGERIEAGGEVWIFGARLQAAGVEGIAAPADLDDQGVDVGAAGISEEQIDLGLGLEAVTVGVDPHASELGGRVAGCGELSGWLAAGLDGWLITRAGRCERRGTAEQLGLGGGDGAEEHQAGEEAGKDCGPDVSGWRHARAPQRKVDLIRADGTAGKPSPPAAARREYRLRRHHLPVRGRGEMQWQTVWQEERVRRAWGCNVFSVTGVRVGRKRQAGDFGRM